ncbi:DMT family transporter [Pseudonocardia acidicola]|uniref:DMT family transporter n=1 Tax=Pseudonocardia acidicola TaxID=2724939 RepID=A0ABX1SDY3_9PSEU|nr:DMT family transporter [Pseudonocardia acidicola]NMH98479.1 DMT family transporter [Pseudonocardia acidicola]
MPAVFAGPAALAYGVADFAGGLAARGTSALRVTAVAQFAGLLALVPAVWVLPGHPSAAALGIGMLAGLAGVTGLLLYFRGLAVGPMGVVAPLSAVVGAGLPLVVGVLLGERPGPAMLIGMLVALVAIVLATAGTRRDAAAGTGLALGLGSGIGFGLFFIALDATPPDSGLWPLLAGRMLSTALLAIVVAARGQRGGPFRGRRLMIASGVLDSGANVLFLLATRTGSLSVSAVLVSLYPVVVVLLARIVLRERLTGLQLTSVGLALTASVLLASGG